jgi:predicted nucleotidyltransferase
MSLSEDFKKYCSAIKVENLSDMQVSAGEVTKKLNSHYYGLTDDKETHLYIVGSVGRNTATKGVSDLDIIFNFQPVSISGLMITKTTGNLHCFKK